MEVVAPLQAILKALIADTDIHICILSLSDIMSNAVMQVDTPYLTHVRGFCNTAKSTKKGFSLCIACKALTIKKSRRDTRPFAGICPFGLTEYVTPVYLDKNLICILYVGHINASDAEMKKRIQSAAARTGVDESRLLLARPKQATDAQRERYAQIGEILKSYILLLCHHFKLQTTNDMHWCIRSINNYVDAYYNTPLSLNQLAKLFFFNENYLGRLYKKEMGIRFSDYVNRVRLEHACTLLKTTEKSVIELAYEAGFNNVTYFNRVFKNTFGMTPTFYKMNAGVNATENTEKIF